MPKLMLLAMEHLRTTKKKKRGVCPRRIEELRIALEMGDDIPPIRVNAMGDGTFVVKDGRHRIGAHHAAGMTQIWAIVENIMRRLFRWLSAQCARNQLQGCREAVFFYTFIDLRRHHHDHENLPRFHERRKQDFSLFRQQHERSPCYQ